MTDIGQQDIAKFYDVSNEWNQLTWGSDTINNYYDLLLLVKTKSKRDNIWISFVEGLHRHAAIIICLLCTKFDYAHNIIKPGSLQLEDFRNADILHYKNPGYNPKQALQMILNGGNAAPMLASQFTFQSFIPKTLDGKIQPIMANMKTHSLWVSINIIDSSRKTILKSLWSEHNNLENWVMYYFYLDHFNLHRVFICQGHSVKQHCSKTT